MRRVCGENIQLFMERINQNNSLVSQGKALTTVFSNATTTLNREQCENPTSILYNVDADLQERDTARPT